MTGVAELDPDAAAFLRRLAAAGADGVQHGTVEQARDLHVASAADFAGPGEPVARVRDLVIAGVPVRTFEPDRASGTAVYAHGGGWVVGTLDSYDPLCRALANRSGATVISVGYDLAPQGRHPVPILQVRDVVRAVAREGGRIALAGDSAGGHTAALATGLAVRDGLDVAGLALIYPVVAPALQTESAKLFAEGLYLETAGMRWYWEHYRPVQDTDVPVDAAAQDLHGFPPSLVLTAGFDPLRDEGLALADALGAAGVSVRRLSYDCQIHGFVRLTALVNDAIPAIGAVGAFLRGCLDRPHRDP